MNKNKEIVLDIGKEYGVSLEQVAEKLLEEMELEINRNGLSDLTLHMEGTAYIIRDIIDTNNIVFKNKN